MTVDGGKEAEKWDYRTSERELTDEQGPQERALLIKLSPGVEEPVLGKRE